MSKKGNEVGSNQVKIVDAFWSQMQERVIDVVIPFQEKVLNDEIPGVEKSHAIENFRIAAGLSQGEFYGMVFQDSDVAKWLEDLKAYALKECLAGKEVPGWKAVEGRGSREWTDMDTAFDTLVNGGIAPEEMLWEKKPLTLAQVEKMIGKKDFTESVGKYVVKKPGKPTLAKETDKRPAVTNKVTAAEAFKTE